MDLCAASCVAHATRIDLADETKSDILRPMADGRTAPRLCSGNSSHPTNIRLLPAGQRPYVSDDVPCSLGPPQPAVPRVGTRHCHVLPSFSSHPTRTPCVPSWVDDSRCVQRTAAPLLLDIVGFQSPPGCLRPLRTMHGEDPHAEELGWDAWFKNVSWKDVP